MERLFRHKSDPWNYAISEVESKRFETVWQLIPSGVYPRILEIGCAEGHFTEQIARRCGGKVLALDFIPLALERAQQRCAGYSNVSFRALDIERDNLEVEFDLIFCMGVLEYRPRLSSIDRISRRITGLLKPGGYLLLESGRAVPRFENRWWARRLGWGSRALHDRFLVSKEMVLVGEALTVEGRRMASLLQKNHA